jgi:drug/metabolite transporter (DMT)-like permease
MRPPRLPPGALPDDGRAVRRSDAVRLVALSAIWGSSFIFIRVIAPVLGPVLTVTTRVLIGGAVLVAYCRIIGLDAQVKRHWRQYAVIGLVNSTLPFMLFAFAALHLPASYSVILNSTAPLFTALWAVPLLDERLTRLKVTGLLTGAAGVALVSRAGPVVPDLWFWIAVLACLGSTTCYALSSIYMKKRAAHLKPLAVAGWSQIFAAIAMAPLVPFAEPSAPLTALIAFNVLMLALFCSSIAYVLYYRLIADIGPTRALTMAFLMPVFGMLWGALFLAEPITLAMIAGCALIIGGATAVLRPARPISTLSPRRL